MDSYSKVRSNEGVMPSVGKDGEEGEKSNGDSNSHNSKDEAELFVQ